MPKLVLPCQRQSDSAAAGSSVSGAQFRMDAALNEKAKAVSIVDRVTSAVNLVRLELTPCYNQALKALENASGPNSTKHNTHEIDKSTKQKAREERNRSKLRRNGSIHFAEYLNAKAEKEENTYDALTVITLFREGFEQLGMNHPCF